MKIIVNLFEFKEFLKKSKKIKTNKMNKNFNDGMYISVKNNVIKAYVSTDTVQIQTIFKGNIIKEGFTVIPKSSLKIIEKLKDGDLQIENDLIINDTKTIKYKTDNEYFVIKQQEKYDSLFSISEDELYRMMEVNYARDYSNVLKREIKCILLNKNRFITLDGYRLSVRSSKQFNIGDANIHLEPDLCDLLAKVIDKKSNYHISVSVDNRYNKYIKFDFGTYQVIGEIGDYVPIKYESIIPTNNKILKINNVKKFMETIKYLENVDTDKKSVIFDITENKLKVSSVGTNITISEEIDVNYSDDDLKTCFNILYLKEAVKLYTNSKELYVLLNEPISPAIITNDCSSLDNIELILPIRLKS